MTPLRATLRLALAGLVCIATAPSVHATSYGIVLDGLVSPPHCPGEAYVLHLEAEAVGADTWVFQAVVSRDGPQNLRMDCFDPSFVSLLSSTPVHWIPSEGGCPVADAAGNLLCIGPITSLWGHADTRLCAALDAVYCYEGSPAYVRG